jgi:diacylglycerol kinase family enzyme
VLRADVLRHCVERVRLEAAPGAPAVPYQVDGDVVGVLPVELGLDPRPLQVRMPRTAR